MSQFFDVCISLGCLTFLYQAGSALKSYVNNKFDTDCEDDDNGVNESAMCKAIMLKKLYFNDGVEVSIGETVYALENPHPNQIYGVIYKEVTDEVGYKVLSNSYNLI